MGRKWLGVVVVLIAVGIAVGVAAFARGGDSPKPRTPTLQSRQFGDDADLMRRLERKKLVERRP